MRKRIICVVTCIIIAFLLTGCDLKEKIEQSIETWRDSNVDFESDAIANEELDDKFYYGLLFDEEEKRIYKELLHGIREQKDSIVIHSEDGEQAYEIFQYILYDFADIFWCEGGCEYTEYSESVFAPAYVEYNPNYTYSVSEVDKMKKEIADNTEKIIHKLSEKKTDYGKVKLAYEWIINSTEYMADSVDNQNIYSTFVANKTVCAGYARGMQYLLDQVDVNCIYVFGDSTDSDGVTESHAWNIVECDGENYIVDATWGDQFSEDEEVEETIEELRPICYEYLCCSEEEVSDTHVEDAEFDYPVCESDKLNYYKNRGMYYSTYDENALLNAMKSSIKNGEQYTVFQFSNRKLYNKAVKVLEKSLITTAAYYMIDLFGLPEVWTQYEEYEDSNKVVVYFFDK